VTTRDRPIGRRQFLRQATALGAGTLVAPSLMGLSACSSASAPLDRAAGFGMLVRSPDVPELWIPRDFRAARLSTTLAISAVNPEWRVAYALDGMAAFPQPNGSVRLVRNHEIREVASRSVPLGIGVPAYDPRAGGGTSTLEVRLSSDGQPTLVAEFPSLAGTLTNCAGGPTPWGSWISCEETTAGTLAGYAREHGYCFEVPSAGSASTAVPLRAMGRFVHEAVAVDPASGIVYLTEDRSYSAAVMAGQGAGFYRFLPARPGQLAEGGQLQMLAVRGQPNYVTARGQRVGQALPVTWVDIADPDPVDAERNPSRVFQQGWALGGAAFERLEGCWFGEGNIYFNATTGGDAAAGQVWVYRPSGGDDGMLILLFESPSREILDRPDNLCVSPRGGLVLCEDGEGVQLIRGLTEAGAIFDLVRTDGPSTEFAGACFSPQGRTLFFNIQGGTEAASAVTSPGATYATWGPWDRGGL
jgi:uncharacterized protein